MYKRSVNLCSCYLLPLIGLNRFSFGKEETFVNSYLSEDDQYLVVEVHNLLIDPTLHEAYVLDYVSPKNTIHIVYKFPGKYREVAKLFKLGKYSHFPESVKNIIREKSGLIWKVPIQGKKWMSAYELLALQRQPELKAKLEEDLGVKIADDAELVSIPDETNFINIQLKGVKQ